MITFTVSDGSLNGDGDGDLLLGSGASDTLNGTAQARI